MASLAGSVRQREGKNVKRANSTPPTSKDNQIEKIVDVAKAVGTSSSEWDFRIALGIITVLAFVTRFWGINHPDQVVFDEVHFGKVRASQ